MPGDRTDFVAACDSHLRLVRVEADLTQDQMAIAIGISKKTLVDIEKGRRTLGWTGAVALCAVFPASGVLASVLGDDPVRLVPALARVGEPAARPAATGGPWWEVVAENDTYIIEQNTISQHYRLLARDRTRIAASFDMADLLPVFTGQSKEGS